MLLILFIRALTLPGAGEGIYYYLYPDMNRLANIKVASLFTTHFIVIILIWVFWGCLNQKRYLVVDPGVRKMLKM